MKRGKRWRCKFFYHRKVQMTFSSSPMRAVNVRPFVSQGPDQITTRDIELTKTSQEAQDPFSFSAPPLTAPRRDARVSSIFPVDTAARERLRYARACMICGSPSSLPGM
jgi:hypothetical protein